MTSLRKRWSAQRGYAPNNAYTREKLLEDIKRIEKDWLLQRIRRKHDEISAVIAGDMFVGHHVAIGGDICHLVDGKSTYTSHQPGVVERVIRETAFVRISEWWGRPGHNHLAGGLCECRVWELCHPKCGEWDNVLEDPYTPPEYMAPVLEVGAQFNLF